VRTAVPGVPDPDRPLAALARTHAFVEPDAGAPGGYRIPGLPRTLLAAQLVHESPALAAILRRVNTDWYAATGPLSDGVLPAVPSPPQRATRRACPRRTAADLSPREREVLQQLAQGRSTTQMGDALALTSNTLRGHVLTLRRKLTAPDRDGIVGRAGELGLL
jgi:DNA-binding CsgD family transcriptional regulator